MDMEILAEILRRRKTKREPEELSKYLKDDSDDVKEVKEITFGDKDVNEYEKSGDSSSDSTDELAPSHAEMRDEKNKKREQEAETFRETIKKEVKPFANKSGDGVDSEGSESSSDNEVFSEKDHKAAQEREKSGRKLGLFDRVQLNIGKRKNK